MRKKLTAEDQLDLFDDQPGWDLDKLQIMRQPGADSLPPPGQAIVDSTGIRYLWPANYWWVCLQGNPAYGFQVKSGCSEAALTKACRFHFKGYPKDSLEAHPLRVSYGGYAWGGSNG